MPESISLEDAEEKREALEVEVSHYRRRAHDAERERNEAQAEARQYREQRDDSRDNVTFLSKSIHEMSPQFFEAERLWKLVDRMGRALQAIPKQMRKPPLGAIIREYEKELEALASLESHD